MIKSYIKTAWRNLVKNKVFSFINIIGLASGLTCFMFIAIFVNNELSYDKYPADAKNMYRVLLSVTGNGDVAVYPSVDISVGKGMKDAFPEIKAATRILPTQDFVKFNNSQFKEEHLAYVDSGFLSLFSIPLIAGNEVNSLTAPYSIVITRDFAKKYFGNEDCLGKTLLLGITNDSYKVTGIIDKVPNNSHFHFDAFLSFASLPVTQATWSNIGYFTYLELNKVVDIKNLEKKFPSLVAKYVVPETQRDMGVTLAEAQNSVNTFKFSLQPLTDIHLHSNTKYELEPNSDIQYIYIFSALALFVLLLACVNFTNLSTARALRRAKEIGIRKVMGSLKKQLIFQFLSESLLLTFFAMLCAYGLMLILLPYYNQLINKNISFTYFFDYRLLISMVLLSLLAGILAGLYPAFYLSGFNTIKSLKGKAVLGSHKKTLQSGLIVFQFFVSISLIIATLIVYKQLHFMQNKKLGFDKEQQIIISDGSLLGNDQAAFKQKLLSNSRVVSATTSTSVPGSSVIYGIQIYGKNEKGKSKEIHADIFHVDDDYIKTLGIKMLQGRNFSNNSPADSFAIIINEAAVQQLGWTNDNAIGKTVVRSGQKEFQVVGVVGDFNYASVKQKVAPLIMILGHNEGGFILKIKTADVNGLLTELNNLWKSFSPKGPLEYSFLDEQFATMYASEQRTQQIFSVFAVIAIIIASLGLFGLSAFVIEQRNKEIGIRKVLGASVKQVLVMVSKDFLILVGLAFIIAIPVTWWAMHQWLQDFAYRINIPVSIFILSGLAAIGIAMLTISFQAIKAAISNPVKSIRTE